MSDINCSGSVHLRVCQDGVTDLASVFLHFLSTVDVTAHRSVHFTEVPVK